MDEKKKVPDSSFMRVALFWILIFLGILLVGNLFNANLIGRAEPLRYDEFYALLENNLDQPTIKSIKKIEGRIEGEYTESYATTREFRGFQVHVPIEDKDLIPAIKTNVEIFKVEPPRTIWTNLLISLAPLLFLILFVWYLSYRGNQMGSRVWSFGRAKARMVEKEKSTKITFHDVAGIDEAKEELQEVIAFLKDPERFQRLGGRIPKGVILVGPPGCGKTLLAKAVAGEAEVPFFSISGSDFVELFVGVGASRVRDLFEQAKKAAKGAGKGCIIFIDEIDAVGRLRFAGIGGGHDEREQTLNQLLAEMDGFQTQEGIIVVAATNRPDVLDPALLRPGRFDRHIVIDAPDIKGREAILKVHTRKIKLSKKIDLKVIAQQTPGFSGADLENLCNEGALLAARRDKEDVGRAELEEAIERVIAGPQRKSRVISKKEKEVIANHEGGHALLSLYLPNVDPLHKVSIIPRGVAALGYTMQLPTQDRYLHSKSELLDRLCVLLGGRAAEEIALGEVTTGAHNDLELATNIARRMVTEFGMSDEIGHVALGRKEGPLFLGKELVEHKYYSEDTAKIIDDEVKKTVEEAFQRAKKVLKEHRDKLEILAKVLLEKEVLNAKEVKKIVGYNDQGSAAKDRKPE